MLSFTKLSRRPRVFQRMTGLTLEEFNQLFDKFRSSWQFFVNREFLSKERKRKFGGGRTSRLPSLEDKLLFILVYTRTYPTMVVLGILFGFEDSRACTWVGRLLPLLDQALGFNHSRPQRGKGRSLEEILAEFPELQEFGISLDGTERPVKRPKDSKKQKSQYSGKKKRHTKKNVLITHPVNRKVVYLSQTRDGPVHDKKVIEEENLSCNIPNLRGITDTGFLGFILGSLRLIMPKKNTKLNKLSESDKEQNRAISSIRVIAEHAICGVKINRSTKDIFRNYKEEYIDLFMSIACGLHNLRVNSRHSS